jgi:hypothetical protein
MGVLILASVALLPLWRPLGPAGVPVLTLTHAPQGLAKALRDEAARQVTTLQGPIRAWVPQTWGSWFEYAVPEVSVAVDSRIELFPPEVWSEEEKLAAGGADWSVGPEARGATFIVVASSQGALLARLRDDGRWSSVYADADGQIWRRVGAGASD